MFEVWGLIKQDKKSGSSVLRKVQHNQINKANSIDYLLKKFVYILKRWIKNPRIPKIQLN